MVYFYIFSILLIVSYLSGFFDVYLNKSLGYDVKESNSIIEFLTKHKIKTKNYNILPSNYSSYNSYIPKGIIIGDKVQMKYEFPLVGNHKCLYDVFLYPDEISDYVDLFGLPRDLVIKKENGFGLNPNVNVNEFSNKMNQDGWFYNSHADYGADYKKIVLNYISFTTPIATQIYNSLLNLKEDNYYNRVQATLNFVQFLPYGLPEFDTDEWYYFGISTPPESFILGYSDCDSKSILFASILLHLIPIENIILVNCTVNSANEAFNGEHMMVAVSDLNINGESIIHNEKKYLLLETTSPIEIGKFEWTSFEQKNIIELV